MFHVEHLEDKMKKIIITDADSLLGQALLYNWEDSTEYNVFAISKTNKAKISNIEFKSIDAFNVKEFKNYCYDIQPDCIVNTAYYDDFINADSNKNEVRTINTDFVENLKKISIILECKLITHSNYLVFDGLKTGYKDDDKLNPVGFLGKSFLAAENSIKMSNIPYCIIRLGFLQGVDYFKTFPNNYYTNLLKSINLSKDVKVPNAYIQPVFALDVANAVEKIIEKDITGIINFAGDEICTMADLLYVVSEIYKNGEFTVEEYEFKKIPNKIELINIKAKTILNIDFTTIRDVVNNVKHDEI